MSYLAPVIALGAVSYVNHWYNGGSPADVKPLAFAGIAGLLLGGIAAAPGGPPVATALGWTAFAGMLIAPVQSPSPVQNLIKITGGKK